MTRRLLVLTCDYGIPVWGSKGASIHLRSMVRAFVEAGLVVGLAARRFGEPSPNEAPLGAALFELPEVPSPGDPGFSPESMNEDLGRCLDAIASRFPFEAVYERMALWSVAGLDASRRRGVPLFLEVNAPLAAETARWRTLRFPEAARAAETRLAREAARIFPVSTPLAEFLAGCGAQRSRIVTLPNSVEAAFLAAGRERLAREDAARLDERPFTIGFVGSLKPWHGIETLFEAFRALESSRSEYRLLIAGDGPLAPVVCAEAATRGTVEYVGAVPHSRVPSLLARMDVAVAPYLEDGNGYFSPLKILEYQAAGVPVIASGGRGIAELVIDGETGLLVPSEEPGRLASAVRRLREDRNLASRLAARGHAQTSARTWDKNVERILREWDGITSAGLARPAESPR